VARTVKLSKPSCNPKNWTLVIPAKNMFSLASYPLDFLGGPLGTRPLSLVAKTVRGMWVIRPKWYPDW
jgi:hypothetical protein